MKKMCALLLTVLMVLSCFTACGKQTEPGQVQESETRIFTDSCGREVEIPVNITKAAPSGPTAQMIVASLYPEALVGLSGSLTEKQMVFLPECLAELPEFGQFYGGKSAINMEAVLAAEPQIVIDIGDYKNGIAEDMDSITEQTGLPAVFINMELDCMAEGYRLLGQLLGREEQAEKIAQFVEKTLNMAAENAEKIQGNNKVRVMLSTMDGLSAIPQGSTQAAVMNMVGVENAVVVEDFTNKGIGNPISLEQIYVFDPDMILAVPSAYDEIVSGEEWKELEAVALDRVYRVPDMPYNWVCNPTSMNMILGVWWMGNLVYPEVYDYDMAEICKEYFSLFYGYDLSDEEVSQLLADSTYKAK